MPVSSPSESLSSVETSVQSTTTRDHLVITESLNIPNVKNLTIEQQNNFSETLIVNLNSNPLNLTGYSILSYIKKHPSSNTISSNFAVNDINQTLGEVSISLGSTMTSQLKEGRYYYDILLINNANGVKRVIQEGMVFVKPGIST